MEQRVDQNGPGFFFDCSDAPDHRLITTVFGHATVIAITFTAPNGACGYWMSSYWPHYTHDQLQDCVTMIALIKSNYPSAAIRVAALMVEEDIAFIPEYSYHEHLKDIKRVTREYTDHPILYVPYVLDGSLPTIEKFVAISYDPHEGMILKTWAGRWVMQSAGGVKKS